MCNVLIIGNPNVGKSTVFNSLTRSMEHTGNFHGVTTDAKIKKIKIEEKEYNFYDLPGIYSLNTFTSEEDVTKQEIFKNNSLNLMVIDCNSLRKNLYLCLQLKELGINYKILLNNYDYFIKRNNRLDVEKLKDFLACDIEIINAKKVKCNKKILEIKKVNNKTNNKPIYLQNFIKNLKNNLNLDEKNFIKAINGNYKNLNKEQIVYIKNLIPEIVKERYDYIDNILSKCLKTDKNFIYGYSKFDKFLLNPLVMFPCFIFLFFLNIYVIFFKIGPFLSDFLINLINFIMISPINNILLLVTDNVWVLDFFSSGICSSILTIFSFLPQICLMFIFITILEDSGIISRLAFVLDDFLSSIGLNGKAVYIILLSLGCNTASTMAIKSLNGKNLKIKSAVINPYISCMARLPIYVIIASAFFNKFAYIVVVLIYILGVICAVILCCVLNKFKPTKNSEIILEFAPIRCVNFKHILQVCYVNAKDFLKRIFGVVLSVGAIVWILSHTQLNLQYTQNINNSILFKFSNLISFIFKPIGLNSAGIVSALIVGFMAKELIVSSLCVVNNASTNLELITSLTLTTSVVNFSPQSAISFLVFSSLYCSCVSNLAVLKKETDTLTMWLSVVSQFCVAYMFSFIVYQTLTRGFIYTLIAVAIIIVLMRGLYIIKKHFSTRCLGCKGCFKKS